MSGGRRTAGGALLRLGLLAAVCGATCADRGTHDHRRVQGKDPPPPPPRDEPWCAQLLERGASICPAAGDLCPEACGATFNSTATVSGAFTHADGAGVVQTNCLVLIMLEGGCAYDLSEKDAALVPGTSVSDVCPRECSGHGQCLAAALDIAFLGSADDSSGFGTTVELEGNACIDGGGVTFDGESWATVTMGHDYGNGAEFSLNWWMLVAPEDVWAPHNTDHPQHMYEHLPQSQSSVVGGILMSISREVWLDAWTIRASIAGTWADYKIDLLRDATPKWSHIAIVVDPTEICVYEDGQLIRNLEDSASKERHSTGTMTLAREAYVGGSPAVSVFGFRGSVAMLQIYEVALSMNDMECVFDSGLDLVQNQRLAQYTASECRGPVTTGCTNRIADNAAESAIVSGLDYDDGSCEFEEHEATAGGEHGIVHVTDSWQRIELLGTYSNPIVMCGITTRQYTTQAIVRVRNVARDLDTGSWQFEVAAERKACHFAQAPPTSEQVDFIVIESGVSAEGWQAGIVHVHDTDWHRVSYVREPEAGESPVVISQAQTADNRTHHVVTRHYFPDAHQVHPRVTEKPFHQSMFGAISDDHASWSAISFNGLTASLIRVENMDPCSNGVVVRAGDVTFMPDGQYDTNLKCSWLIHCPIGTPVVQITSLQTEEGFDYVHIFE